MAVQAKVPIIPVVIANYYDFYSAKEKRFNAGTLRCRVLPAISTENVKEESADIEKLANECRDKMLIALKEITPAHTNTNKKTK
jgi:lysophosphatidate acyltransferase